MHESILDALRRGDAPEALSAARDAVAAQPEDAMAYRLLAAALRLGGDREGAITAIDRAIDLAPDEASLHLERAGLLLQERQLDEAQAALARGIGLDPNQFPAYIVQAHLALGRGDLDEAERLARTAGRIAPEHPHVSALEGTLALRRGNPDRALAILSGASERWPDDLQLRHSLAFAYLAKGHFAFAEQAFRALQETSSDSLSLRALIADLMRRQGRSAEAADEMAPLLERPDAPVRLKRLVGQIELEAGRHERAVPLLRDALAAEPDDRRTILALAEAWRRSGDVDDARATLDAALATHPRSVDLWRTRLMFEPFAGEQARALVDRWLALMPDSVAALETLSTIHHHHGEHDQAEAIAARITELRPGHSHAELRVLDGLNRRGDHQGAIARVEGLIARATTDEARLDLRQLLGTTYDIAGRPHDAATTWSAVHAELAARHLPLPPVSATPRAWPERAAIPPSAGNVLFLWGAPGSQVERLAQTLTLARAPFRGDRFGARPPTDLLQRYGTATGLADGSVNPEDVVTQWRATLPARGIGGGQAMDWLLWWDNALLLALRPHLPEAELMIALRDPRDMLLDWLAWGSPARFGLASPTAGADWLAAVLGQVADLHEQNLMPHHLIKLDDIAENPVAMAQAIADALKLGIAAGTPDTLGPRHFPPGHWRVYAEPLADAFATLTPVAQRLGYPGH